ncbi:hypothetical protein [Thioalkalivibrio paradoxus]|uniref:hypothetical protein n=1 Tax=Thioalkalivibrio paradoxus TaxID=108010 RepID=UPI001E4F807B|nr:hypothetical protein [Thioalkalivibrio paradoxus]
MDEAAGQRPVADYEIGVSDSPDPFARKVQRESIDALRANSADQIRKEVGRHFRAESIE